MTAADTHQTKPRLTSVDQIRGVALVLMALFHFSYDLSLYGYLSFDSKAPFWAIFRGIIVVLFFATVGISLVLANRDGMRWPAFWKREAKIVAGAAAISLATWLAYPHAWVWFGVLHFIAVASLLAVPVIFYPRIALILGIAILALFNITDWFNLQPLHRALAGPLHLPTATVDLTRLIPWLGMVYIGIYLGHRRLFGVHHLPLGPFTRPLVWLGQHSLGFYLLHQLPLFGLAWLIHWLIQSSV
ncbi:heparan-alpha-glucosaminide N-acetyltransferase [Saccharospirillum sp. HFRX-1]|uniref:heparan-alpha-glucosaminide N-acetyltransferase n=1 Tax=unclassified Saccharospirillum TaxID=2633430 RepID=UPI003714D191